MFYCFGAREYNNIYRMIKATSVGWCGGVLGKWQLCRCPELKDNIDTHTRIRSRPLHSNRIRKIKYYSTLLCASSSLIRKCVLSVCVCVCLSATHVPTHVELAPRSFGTRSTRPYCRGNPFASTATRHKHTSQYERKCSLRRRRRRRSAMDHLKCA